MKRVLLALLASLALAAAVYALSSGPGSELPPPSTGGLVVLDPLLQKLTNNRRLLIIGAHPDDENTALLALVSRKMGGEAAYLSLSRGEGGQNLIGEELGVGLGLIRSQELAAARRLDGAHQFFTRAYDFGFTRSLDETLGLWPKQVLLEDTVRILRRFRPQVVFSTFTGTERDGHGQHQASGIVAPEAFHAAGDPAAFPELLREGLTPWKPTTLVRSNWFDRSKGILLPTGNVDPLTGRSYHQIAMASRSLHRSQDMGMLQPPGPNETGVIWVEGGAGPDTKELFGGVDTRLASIAAEVSDPVRRKQIEDRLATVEKLAEETRRQLSPANLNAAVSPLSACLEELRAARALVKDDTGNEAGVAMLLDEKISAAEAALAAAAGVSVDALADKEAASPGESFSVTASVWNAGSQPVDVEDVSLASPDGWTATGSAAPGKNVAAGTLADWKLEVSVPAGAPPTLPYFLRQPLRGALYDWSAVPSTVRGEPFQPAPLSALVSLRIGGSRVQITREATYRYRDEAVGEIRHPLRAVPRLDVAVEPDLIVWPTSKTEPKRLEVTLTSNSPGPLSGQLLVEPPPGWPAVPPRPFSLAKKGDRALLELPLAPHSGPGTGRFEIPVAAALSDGERFARSIRLVDYEHIRPTPLARSSTVALTTLDLRLPAVKSVGYVRGAADRVPEALSSIGLPIHVLTARELEKGDLSRYDAIVVGPRAYETDATLSGSNGRLLDYARGGGLVIVQYQQYPFIEGNFAPAKLEIARPHDRVTDEAAKVTILAPGHPIFTSPNRIEESDWSGWVQERGLYFAHTWDPAYTPLLSMADPGGPEQKGSLLVVRVGKGRYIYTGLAFFRQLPAGVPGAYRLFANLLAWRAKES